MHPLLRHESPTPAPLTANHYRTIVQSRSVEARRRSPRCHRISACCITALFATHPWPPPPKPSLSQLYVSIKSVSGLLFLLHLFCSLVNLFFFFWWFEFVVVNLRGRRYCVQSPMRSMSMVCSPLRLFLLIGMLALSYAIDNKFAVCKAVALCIDTQIPFNF